MFVNSSTQKYQLTLGISFGIGMSNLGLILLTSRLFSVTRGLYKTNRILLMPPEIRTLKAYIFISRFLDVLLSILFK